MSKRSSNWLHFKVGENKNVGICCYCGTKISVRNCSTANLGRHLKKKHPTVSIDKFDPAEVSDSSATNSTGEGSSSTRLKDVESEPTNIGEFLEQNIHEEVITFGEYGSTATQSVTTVPRRRKGKIPLEQEGEIQQHAGERLNGMMNFALNEARIDDEFEAFGTYIAHKLRSLERQQAIFARKLINDVIFEGELETLNKNFQVTDSQIHVSFANNDPLR